MAISGLDFAMWHARAQNCPSTNSTGALHCSHNREHHMQSLNPYNTTTTTLSTILGKSFNTAILGNQLDQSIILVERNPKRYGALNMAISGLDFAMWRAPLRVEKPSSSHLWTLTTPQPPLCSPSWVHQSIQLHYTINWNKAPPLTRSISRDTTVGTYTVISRVNRCSQFHPPHSHQIPKLVQYNPNPNLPQQWMKSHYASGSAKQHQSSPTSVPPLWTTTPQPILLLMRLPRAPITNDTHHPN